jgi:hypothetical protein
LLLDANSKSPHNPLTYCPRLREVVMNKVVGLGILALALVGCGDNDGGPDTGPLDRDAPMTSMACSGADASRGQMQVMTRACGGCHGGDLGGQMSMTATPGSNLTQLSIEGWTEPEIAAAILTGVDHEGAMLCASMPRYGAAGMTNEQACDIAAHLRTLAPITRAVRPCAMP